MREGTASPTSEEYKFKILELSVDSYFLLTSANQIINDQRQSCAFLNIYLKPTIPGQIISSSTLEILYYTYYNTSQYNDKNNPMGHCINAIPFPPTT